MVLCETIPKPYSTDDYPYGELTREIVEPLYQKARACFWGIYRFLICVTGKSDSYIGNFNHRLS